MNSLIQGTPEWLEMRRKYIGASDAPVIMGDSPWKTPLQLFEEKIGLVSCTVDNIYMKRGRELESVALEEYNKLTNANCVPQVVFHKDIKYMMASLDGLDASIRRAVEIKCPGKADHDAAVNGIVPDKYFAQLQHQLEVLGYDSIHYFSFCDGQGVLVEVKRDDAYIKRMLKKESEFWEHVTLFDPPPMCSRDYVERSDEDWIALANEWRERNEALKDLMDKEKESRLKLIEMSKNQSSIGGGVQITKFSPKGRVDYSNIPELKDVDLEKYRKPPTTSWRLTSL